MAHWNPTKIFLGPSFKDIGILNRVKRIVPFGSSAMLPVITGETIFFNVLFHGRSNEMFTHFPVNGRGSEVCRIEGPEWSG